MSTTATLNKTWRSLFKVVAAAALIIVILIPIGAIPFVITQRPDTVNGWFTLIQSNSARTGGGITLSGPDYLITFQPEAWDSNNPVVAKLGEWTGITLTLTAEPYYNASLPVSIKVNNVPLDFYVGPKNATAILTTGGSVSFILNVFTPVSYTADFLPPPTDPHPHFDVQISFLGQTDSYPVYIVSSNK